MPEDDDLWDDPEQPEDDPWADDATTTATPIAVSRPTSTTTRKAGKGPSHYPHGDNVVYTFEGLSSPCTRCGVGARGRVEVKSDEGRRIVCSNCFHCQTCNHCTSCKR
jgi:hypothetical protein